jgi:hypothetical protein
VELLLLNNFQKQDLTGINVLNMFILVGVSRYHFCAKAHSEMIVYTFLLPGKNEKAKWLHYFVSS